MNTGAFACAMGRGRPLYRLPRLLPFVCLDDGLWLS